MKSLFLSVLVATGVSVAHAQNALPAGGGGYSPPPGECVTPAQYRQINSLLDTNIKLLTQQGVLPAPGSQRPTTVPLAWPLRQAAGFGYNSIYGISNYVDHNALYPNQVRDWNCGTRTYDTAAGYNHAGLDIFLWPFDMNMMASGQAEIVAAADGIIITKTNGNFDRNCTMSTTSNWNAVYVQHADGTVAWYGHMKNGSLTAKPIGASVAQGEFLGTVGSSGSSTGPHLHFELYSASGVLLDPYNGTCSTPAGSWATQKPYYESTLNTLMTHAAPPVFNTCPAPHTINATTNFAPGTLAYFASYFHDQQTNQPTSYTIYRPNNAVFATWTHSSPAAYTASYWYWSYTLPATGTAGTWRFTATYQGTTTTQNFTVGTATATTAAARAAAFALYPNPASRQVTIELAAAPLPGAVVELRNPLGQVVARQPLTARQVVLALPAAAGLYLLTLPTAAGPVTQKLLVE